MRTQGSSAAKLLLLLFCTTTRSATINERIVRSIREAISSTMIQTTPVNDQAEERLSEFPIANSSVTINGDDNSSATDGQNVVSKKENVRTDLDQQVDQSETLSVLEYEPQKINKKKKRKIAVPYKNTDIVIPTDENKDPIPTLVGNVYYDPPQITNSRKIATIPKYYPNTGQEGPKPSETVSEPKDTEYPYPASASNRPNKSRHFKSRSWLNPQITLSPENTKLEIVPTASIALSLRSHSPVSDDWNEQRRQAESSVTSVPSIDVSQPSRTVRRKKGRKRPRDKLTSNESAYQLSRNSHNYTDDYPKVRPSTAVGNKIKPNRLGKYDVASRPYPGIDSSTVNEESDFEKNKQKVVVVNTNQWNASSSKKEDSNDHQSKANEPVSRASIGSRRRLYERKRTRDSSDDETPALVQHDETGRRRFDSSEPTAVRRTYHESPMVDKIVYKDESKLQGDVAQMTPSSLETYQYVNAPMTASSLRISENSKLPTVTGYGSGVYRSVDSALPSSNLQSYGNVVHPTTTSDSEDYANSIVSTTGASSYTPHAERTPAVTVYAVNPTASTIYPSLTHYAAAAPTLPVHDYQTSVSSSWTPDTDSTQLKVAKPVVGEADGASSDAVVAATKLGSEEQGDSREDRRIYVADDGPSEREIDTERSHGAADYPRRVDEQVQEAGEVNGDGEHRGHRYAQRYDDVQAEGSHDGDVKHHESKESVMSDGKGKDGGKAEFEEGQGAKHEEGHHEMEDEKEEKGYESWHKEEKSNKGHHDKEQHSNNYDEEDGEKKEDKEEGEYHEEHQQGEKGEKGAEFDENGKHQKGHNTKGQHFVHKKDEFEKRTEFYDEFQEDGGFEKDGGFHRDHESSNGGHENKGHLDKHDHQDKYGKEMEFENGKHYHQDDGQKLDEGQDSHYEHQEMHGKKQSQQEEKDWAYKNGDGGDGNKKDR